ncbi:hypothetical protein J2T17_001983 [Paenibacillus mucilaginosus]
MAGRSAVFRFAVASCHDDSPPALACQERKGAIPAGVRGAAGWSCLKRDKLG